MSYIEFPVFVPLGEDHLCGIVCVPEQDGSDMGVVLLTGGNYTRTHRNRMWVRTARHLADAGFPSIRIDYHGVGDSSGRAVFDMEAPFDDDAVAAADFLVRATAVSRLTFLATCFGGRTAMAAAARHPKATVATLFPVPLLVPRGKGRVLLRTRLRNRLRTWGWGKKLFARPAVRRARNVAAARKTQPVTIISPRFKRAFVDFLNRGDVRFIYGERSDTIDDLRSLLAEVEPRLSDEQRQRIHVQVLADCAPESFRSLDVQDVAVNHAVLSVVAGLEATNKRDASMGRRTTLVGGHES